MSSDPRAFKAIREEWSDYKVSDGSVIRIKLILTFIDGDGTGKGGISMSHVVGAWSPKEMRKPDKAGRALAPAELEKDIAEDNLSFERLAEGPSEYEIGSTRLTMRSVPERISRARSYGPGGIPQYLVKHSVSIEVVSPVAAVGGAARRRPAKAPRSGTRRKSRA